MTLSNDAINAAAKWWSDFLRPTTPPASTDLGLPPLMAGRINMMLDLLREATLEKAAPDLADRFEVALREQLQLAGTTVIRVDYDPDDVLLAAGEASGVDVSNIMPFKTTMHLRDDAVDVFQSGRAPKRLWPL